MTAEPFDDPLDADPGASPAGGSGDLRRALEAILMAATEPVAPSLLAQLLEVPEQRIEDLCSELAADYDLGGRGFVLARVAGGYRYQTHPDQAAYVERFVLEGQTSRLSSAALETLAIIAYKQPISRAQVASIRGVNVDGVVRTLQQRGYVAEVGRDPGPGQAVLLGTTPLLLEKLGIDSLDQLPALGDFVPAPEVVEALEHGLRIDRAGGDEPSEASEASEATEATGEPADIEALDPAGGTGDDPAAEVTGDGAPGSDPA